MLIRELLNEDINNIPFDTNPEIGFWSDQDSVIVYHGTHERNVPDILKNGLTRVDPKTNMISVTFDPFTAHGYAAMSGAGGEAGFRAAGARPVNTPHNERAVIKMKIPMEWVKKHMDPHLSGNVGDAKTRLQSKDDYAQWKSSNKPDHEFYQTSELRFDKPVPPNFIVGVMKRYPKK